MQPCGCKLSSDIGCYPVLDPAELAQKKSMTIIVYCCSSTVLQCAGRAADAPSNSLSTVCRPRIERCQCRSRQAVKWEVDFPELSPNSKPKHPDKRAGPVGCHHQQEYTAVAHHVASGLHCST